MKGPPTLLVILPMLPLTLGDPIPRTGPPCAIIDSFSSGPYGSESQAGDANTDSTLRMVPQSNPSPPLLFGPPLTPAYLMLKVTADTKSWQCSGNPFPAQVPLSADWKCEGTGALFDGKPLLVCYQSVIGRHGRSDQDVNLIIGLFIMFVLGIMLTEAWDRWDRRRSRSEISESIAEKDGDPDIEGCTIKDGNTTELSTHRWIF